MPGGTEAFEVNVSGTSVDSALGDREHLASQVLAAKTDPQAFEALYRGHVDAIYRYCYRRLSSGEAAADATSQIFIKAFTSLHTCNEQRFRSWLFAIAHNVLVDEYRTRHSQDTLDAAGEIASRDPSPEDLVLQEEERVTVVQLLSYLTQDQRQIVELRLAGLNGNEIAEALGRTRGSVDTAQSRAISRLREVLGREGVNGTALEVRNVSA